MRWRIVAVGKPRLSFAREGILEYLTRLRCFTSVENEVVKPSQPSREAVQLLALSEGSFRLVLDERGRLFTSRDLATHIDRIELGPFKSCALIVGGADGLDPSVRSAASLLWSLSPLTLQHEMALLLSLEQLYRAHTIRAGLPYHRD